MESQGVYWLGADGNTYVKAAGLGAETGGVLKLAPGWDQNQNAVDLINSLTRIDDPNPPQETTPSLTTSAPAPDPDAAIREQLRGEIGGYSDDIQNIYTALFGDLDTLVKERDTELETQYGDQLKKATGQYTEALPVIDQSYSAIGSYDSTNRGDARGKAKSGFEETTKTIGKNKEADKTKLGQYKTEQAAKFKADQESATRNIGRAGETSDVDALRGLRNEVETNLDTAGVTRATLGSGGSARKAVSDLTADSGRYEAAVSALDAIIKSSMSGAVKEAAVKAVTDSAGLSNEEKDKIQQQYGNVYAEQAAL